MFLIRYKQRGGLLLYLTTKDSSVRDSLGKVSNLRINLAHRTTSEKHKFITTSITFHWSPFVKYLVYDKPKIKFMPSSKQIEHNRRQQH
jgi:hypothetical protein